MLDDKCLDVTVIVATYNQELKKTILTLESIVKQKNIALQVIIADDGSKENHFLELKKWFQSKGFKNYILLSSEENQGTVKNFARCTSYIQSPYVKLISPGDFFFKEDSLYQWVCCIREAKGGVSFCDTIYYSLVNGRYQTISARNFPQYSRLYLSEKNINRARYTQLIYDDFWLGAAVLLKTELFSKYINLIVDKVVYAEDNIYRLMSYNHESITYFQCEAIVYEYSAGVTSLEKANEWRKRLIADWYNASLIMIDTFPTDKMITKKLIKYVEWKNKSNIRFSKCDIKKVEMIKDLLKLYLSVPDAMFWHIKLKFFMSYSLKNIEIEKYLNAYFGDNG